MLLTEENRSSRRKTCVRCHCVPHKSYTDWPGIETGSPQSEADDWPPWSWHGLIIHRQKPGSM